MAYPSCTYTVRFIDWVIQILKKIHDMEEKIHHTPITTGPKIMDQILTSGDKKNRKNWLSMWELDTDSNFCSKRLFTFNSLVNFTTGCPLINIHSKSTDP